MKNNIARFFKRVLHQPALPYILILSIIFMVIALANFPFGKWLIGWDNILPELNFAENLKRGLYSAWQENEGLGLMGGHGFATTLPHTLLLWGMSLAVPLSYLRPVFHLLMLYIGSLGSFFLIEKMLHEKKDRHMFAFVAGLFYMINFGTVQMFYIPLEAFSAHFAFLPWLIYTLINVFEKRSVKNLALFALVSLGSTMQGFIPPLFIVYMVLFGILAVSFVFTQRTWKAVVSIVIAGLITLAVNAYWLFPIGYYTLFNSQVYLNSYNNQTTTDEFILKNQKYGHIHDLVQLKGFISESMDTGTNGQAVQIFAEWNTYLNSPVIVALTYIAFAVIFIGFVVSLWKGNWIEQAFATIGILIFSFLATDTLGFSVISDVLRNHIPVFKQAFRIPFTKFIIATALMYAAMFAVGLQSIVTLIQKKIGKTQTVFTVLIVSAILTIIQFFPVFKGGLFYDRTRIDLPQEYLDLFAYFQKQDSAERIANFPQPIPTGWTVYNWGYSGSGFLWYGLSQPILDRNFDVWSNNNENYYWEVSRAVYSEEPQSLMNVLQKYNVSWIMIDENVTSFTEYRTLFYDRLEEMLSELPEVQKTEQFGDISVYQVKQNRQTIQLFRDIPDIEPGYSWSDHDEAFANVGYYVSGSENTDQYYPYRSLFTGRGSNDLETDISQEENHYVFPLDVPNEWNNGTLNIPEFNPNEFSERDIENLAVVQNSLPVMRVNGNTQIMYQEDTAIAFSPTDQIEILIPKVSSYSSYNSRIVPNEFIGQEVTCDTGMGTNSQRIRNNLEETFVRFNALDSNSCRSIYLSQLDQETGYIVAVYSRNIEGTPLKFWVENATTKRADQITYLEKNTDFHWEYFIIPPMSEGGLGYTLHFDNQSIGQEQVTNDLGEVVVQPIPYRFFTEMYLGDTSLQNSTATDVTYDRISATEYEVSLGNAQDGDVLTFYQGFDPGWKAYSNGKELTEHVKINNWANGWIIENADEVHGPVRLVFWPQYLQTFGFGMLGMTVLLILSTAIYTMFRNRK